MRNLNRLQSIIYTCALTCLCLGALVNGLLSDKRLCADPKCEKPISLGTALITYPAGAEGFVSVKINSKIRIMSKGAGTQPNLWGVDVNGRRGYLPSHVIKETKILVSAKDLQHIVPVDGIPAKESAAAVVAEAQSTLVLNASEGVKIDLETTTTAPLDVQIKADAGIITGKDIQENIKTPTPVASPVQQRMEIIEGTQLPVADINSERISESIAVDSKVPAAKKVITEPLIPVSPQLPQEKNDATKAQNQVLGVNEVKTETQLPVSTPMPSQIRTEENAIKPESQAAIVKEEVRTEAQLPVSSQLPPQKNTEGNAIKTESQAAIVKEEVRTEAQLPVSSQLPSQINTEGNAIKTESQDPIVNAEVKTEPQFPFSEQLATEKISELNDSTNAKVVQEVPSETIKAEAHAPSNKENVEGDDDYGDDYDDDDDSIEDDYKENDIPTDSLLEHKNETQQSGGLKTVLPENAASSEVGVKANTKEEIKEVKDKEVVPDSTNKKNIEKPIEELEDNKKHDTDAQTLDKMQLDTKSNDSEVSLKIGETSTDHNVINNYNKTQQGVENQHKSETIVPNEPETVNVTIAEKYTESTEDIQVKPVENVNEKEAIKTVQNQNDNKSAGTTIASLLNEPETKSIESSTQFTPIQEEIFANVERTVTEPGFHYEPNDHDFDVTTVASPTKQEIEHQIHTVPSATPLQQQYSSDKATQEQSVDFQNKETKEKQTKNENLPHQQLNQDEKRYANENSDAAAQNIENNVDPNVYYQQQRNEYERLHSNVPKSEDVTEQHAQQYVSETTYTTEATTNLHEQENLNEQENLQSFNSIENDSNEPSTQNQVSSEPITESTPPIALPSILPPDVEVAKKDNGLFATILGTVNNFLSNDKKEPVHAIDDDQELARILFPERAGNGKSLESAYCDRLVSDCPSADGNVYGDTHSDSTPSGCYCERTLSVNNFIQVLAGKVLDMSDMLVCLSIAAATSLFFIFGYYCFCNSSREGALLSKLNLLERSLLATHKENAILKHEIMETRGKLSSIQDNSFGSNDMVIALKKELEEEIFEKHKLQEQVGNLEKELENAAEAGLELNKIVSELLSNQTGDESIISSVEELQRQLNEQQNTIYEINTNLAEKSRENSELQLMLAEQNARFGGEIASLQQDNDELEAEKSNLQTRLDEIKNEFEEDITKALEGKNSEIRRLQVEITDLNVKCENEHMRWQTSLAKIEALEECLKTVKRDPSVNIKEVIDVANVRADLLDLQKQRASLKERLDAEKDSTKMLNDQIIALNAEVEKLKHEFHQSEKDKLEAQTRLEVLSNYFKEKEMQLQKELSVKEAMWLKQSGETTSTVDRLTSMQDEIQSLKSQNDALRAEIVAQIAAQKAQTGTLENRAYETWLEAKQSERRCEEARAEATALRRKLTALVGGNANEVNRLPNAGGDGKPTSGELNNAHSPIHMESPGSPLLGRMPLPPFLPPPFMGPPPPFMGMPPPFMPPGEMRPPPLGRLMSPAPPSVGPPHPSHMRSGRYTPPDRGDYDDYDDDDDDDLSPHRGRRRSIGGNGSWRRDSYSPPRTYRSHSPADSRYNYTTDRDLISRYDTETDISPPPSPRERRQRAGRAGSFKAYSPQPTASSPISEGSRNGRKSSVNKGALSTGSEKSYNSSSRHGNKAKGKGKGMV